MNFDFNLQLEKATREDSGIFLQGCASTTGIDKQNEVMSIEVLNDMAKAVGIPLTLNHRAEIGDIIGKVVESKVVDDKFFVKAKLNENDPRAVALFDNISDGHKCGFSIGGSITKSEPGLNKSIRRRITGVLLDHLATTRRPVNGDTFAMAFTKAFDTMQKEDTIKADVVAEVVPADELSKSGATHSAETIAALKNIHNAGNDEVKAQVRILLGDNAEKALGNAVGPETDAPHAQADPIEEVAEGSNVDDDDKDDAGITLADVGEAVNHPVAGKSLSAEEFSLLKAEIVNNLKDAVKAEFAKSMKQEAKVAEVAPKVSRVPSNSLSEAIRNSLGG